MITNKVCLSIPTSTKALVYWIRVWLISTGVICLSFGFVGIRSEIAGKARKPQYRRICGDLRQNWATYSRFEAFKIKRWVYTRL